MLLLCTDALALCARASVVRRVVHMMMRWPSVGLALHRSVRRSQASVLAVVCGSAQARTVLPAVVVVVVTAAAAATVMTMARSLPPWR